MKRRYLILLIFFFIPFFAFAISNSKETNVNLQVETGFFPTCNSNGICEFATRGETKNNCWTDCGCNNNGICQTEREENSSNCPQDCGSGGTLPLPPPPLPPTPEPEPEPEPDTVPPVIYDLLITEIDQDSAKISWKTNENALCTLSFGKTLEYEIASISEIDFSLTHLTILTNLLPKTIYYFEISCKDSSNNQSQTSNQTFITLAPIDTVAPADINNFEAIAGDTIITLKWQNPLDIDFKAVKIVRSDNLSYPEKVFVYDNSGTSFTDINLTNGVRYSYTAFTYDFAGNFSLGVTVSAVPEEIIPVEPEPEPEPEPGPEPGLWDLIEEKFITPVVNTIQEIKEEIRKKIEEIKEITQAAKEVINKVVIKPIVATIQKIQENPKIKAIVENPVVDTTVKIVVTVGAGVAASTGITSLAPIVVRILDAIQYPSRLVQLLGALLFRRRRKHWGVVYDSFTKQPLDPVYVVLRDKTGKEIQTQITDMQGRFGFLVFPGEYYIKVSKTYYKFPSEKIKGTQDELYENLYHGESLQIADSSLISINIPMDPVGFDWNEVVKRKIAKFNYHWEVIKKWLFLIIFPIGFVLSFLFFILKFSLFNIVAFCFYIILFILRRIGFKEKSWGFILDKKTKKPLSFAILKIFFSGLPKCIKEISCDALGRYYTLVVPGRYDIEIDEKKEEEYQSIAKYFNIEVKKGILNKDLFVSKNLDDERYKTN